MIKFDFVYGDTAFEEIRNYIEENREELQKYGGELNVDYATYREVSQGGQLVYVTLHGDGKLVGFSVFYLASSLRNKREVEATNHGIYVDKAYRKKFGTRMFTESRKFLERLGVNKILYVNDSPAFGRMMKRMGAKINSQTWSFENGK